MKMTFFERLIKYYDFDDESRITVKIGKWLDEKVTEKDRKDNQFNPEYWFWGFLLMAYIASVAVIPQIITYFYYWITLLRYPRRVGVSIEDIHNLYIFNEEIEKWCKDNGIKMFYLFKFFTKDMLLFSKAYKEKHDLAFRHKEDLMAFKLAWL